MNKYHRLFSDTLIFGFGNFTTKFLYFFLMPIYTLALTTEEFGLADLLNNSLYLAMPILTLCISDAVFRFTLDKDSDHKLLLCNGLRVLMASFAIFLVVILIVYIFYSYTYWWLFFVLYVSESLKSLFAQFTRGLGKVKEFAINGILGAMFLLSGTYLLLGIFKLGINGYLLSLIVANITSLIYLLYKVRIDLYLNFTLYNKVVLRNMLLFSLPLIPNMLSWWITNISSRYIIAGYCGLGIAGLFAGASKIPALINVLASVFQQSWQFASVKEYQEASESNFYSRVFHYYSFFVIMSSTTILVSIPYISYFILKGEFLEAWIYTPLLLFSATLGCYSIFFGTFYAVVKDNKKAMYSTMVGAGINIVLCFLLIPLINVAGALVANVISYSVIVILRIRDAKKYINISINRVVVLMSLLLLLGQAIVLSIPFDGNIFIAVLIPFVLAIIYRHDFVRVFSFLKMLMHN